MISQLFTFTYLAYSMFSHEIFFELIPQYWYIISVNQPFAEVHVAVYCVGRAVSSIPNPSQSGVK